MFVLLNTVCVYEYIHIYVFMYLQINRYIIPQYQFVQRQRTPESGFDNHHWGVAFPNPNCCHSIILHILITPNSLLNSNIGYMEHGECV